MPPISSYFKSSFTTASKNLIKSLKARNIIISKDVENVMKTVDRADFCDDFPYDDSPQSIGYNATISAPHMHAHVLELLKDRLKDAKRCLDVGSGSGYLTLAFAKMMLNSGAVSYGVEHIPELVERSILNIKKHHKNFLEDGKVVVMKGDGRLGCPDYQPFDCIHVGAAAEHIPTSLLDQLNNGGRLIIPVGEGGMLYITIVDKDIKGNLTRTKNFPVAYVPLTSSEEQVGGEDFRKSSRRKI